MWRRTIVSCAVCVGLFSAAAADEGRIPIWEPVVITESGHYFLTRNISAPGPVVTVSSSQALVEIDLNGYLLVGEGPSPVIQIAGDGVTIIHNGGIVGGTYGIWGGPGPEDQTGGFRVESTLIANPSLDGIHITASADLFVRDCDIFDPEGAGIFARTETAEIRGNLINSPGGNGIHLAGTPSGGGTNAVQADVSDNQVETPQSGDGIRVEDFGSVRITGNSVVTRQTAQWGIHLFPTGGAHGGAVIHRNKLRGEMGASGGGILVKGQDNSLQHNSVTGMGSTGIRIEGSRNTISHNLTSDNAGDGIAIVSGIGNLIDDNSSQGNACGIFFNTTGNAYRDNMLRGNLAAVCNAPNTDAGGNIL